jgi:hypothetical protein
MSKFPPRVWVHKENQRGGTVYFFASRQEKPEADEYLSLEEHNALLKAKDEENRNLLTRIIAMAGNPNAADGCRNIIGVAKAGIESLSQQSGGSQ